MSAPRRLGAKAPPGRGRLDHGGRRRRRFPFWATLLALFLSTGAERAPRAAQAPAAAELAGTWVARPVLHGRSGLVGLRLVAQPDGTLTAELDLPPIDAWAIPLGPARLEAGGLVVGGTRFAYDPAAGVLRGALPAAIVPKYPVTARFERAEAAPTPGPPPDFGPPAEPVWTTVTGGPVWSGPAVDGGTVYVGSDDGRLHALAATDGSPRWTFATGGFVRARPAVDGGRVYFPSDDGFLYCLEAGDGSPVWTTRLVPGPVPRSAPGTATARYDHYAAGVAFAGDVLYTATLAGEVLALDRRDGAVRWRRTLGDAVQGTPAVADGRVIVGSFDHHVHALDAGTGEPLWRFDAGAPVVSAPAVAGDLAIVGSRAYDLWALDVATGAPRWRDYFWFSWVESSASLAGGTAYVGSSDARHLLALEAATGRRTWRFPTAGSAWGQPAVAGEAVYIGSVGVARYISDHRPGFYGVARRTGRALWSYLPAPDPDAALTGFASSPAADHERVYVGGLDGRVYAFAQRGGAPAP